MQSFLTAHAKFGKFHCLSVTKLFLKEQSWKHEDLCLMSVKYDNQVLKFCILNLAILLIIQL